jgi:hypothetical protein
MLEAGVVRKSSSSYASPILLVPKEDHTWRFRIDFRRLNEDVIVDRYPLPVINEVFDKMAGAKVFSVLDLKSGYWQIPLAKESCPLTTFRTEKGLFEYTRLPFGLNNAPAMFSRVMSDVLEGLPGVSVYIDDVFVFAPNMAEQKSRLEAFFDRLQKFGLQVNPKQVQLGVSRISLLGHVLATRESNLMRVVSK